MRTVLKTKIEEITDGFLIVIMAAMTNDSLNLEKSYVKDQIFLDTIASLASSKRTVLRKKLLKEVEEISEAIVEEMNELTKSSKH